MKTIIKTIIQITDHTHPLTERSYIEIEDELMPKDIWEDFKKAENATHIHGNAGYLPHTIKSLKCYLTTSINKNYKYVNAENIVKDLDFSEYDYILEIDWEQTIMYVHAHHKGNYEQDIMCFTDRYITDTKNNEGNCIDDFILRGVDSRIGVIHELMEDILSRLDQRQVAIEYHNTGCYEKDFTQIALIKKQAQIIVDNCNKQLERIADNYTKL